MTKDPQISEAYKILGFFGICVLTWAWLGESAGVALYHVSDIPFLNRESIPCVRAQLCNHSTSLYSVMSAKSQVTWSN